ncbi:MAG: chemotaxis protein CheW [Gammaproteobacteria bacterium]|uniref:chemotaxis protein CheW n=1 Tax=Rhodoferax sp. TaxID=50421 RepID=UPI0018068A1E|nr:chemotaxis protein CheW [Rhodoferax sp.]MBU3900445.1 chemotaxis protein CheW [Gammaproteobacteria bacterium]MBA3059911.1 chemotaxis protein CheA [Rhodoferax sp.]MBU3998444.1 chemotaxis protein CheW [Gammaproteobacteria bacterium]MBU4079890.1 chemotaxis protein CheW [Gammaproteobacteria bacterium]MBU4112905.1 chemotaxis protein CheW [Gammaproteobacteria bacterium]
MAEVHQESSSSAGDFDLSQFYQIFFEEAAENLDLMEQMLLSLNLETADDEELNAIFRCAHSVKGGAATFGFSDVAELTHQMESLLDRLRRHELQPNASMVDVLLESADASRGLLARHQAGGEGDAPPTVDLVRRIKALVAGELVPATPAPVAVAAAAAVVVLAPPVVSEPASAPASSKTTRSLEIRIGPLENLAQADAIKELFRDIEGLGDIAVVACNQADTRIFAVETSSTDADLLDLFAFHVSREQVSIKALDEVAAAVAAAPELGYGFFDGAAGAPESSLYDDDPPPGAPLAPLPGFGFFDGAPGAPAAGAATSTAVARVATKPAAAAAAQPEAATIRVAISKVDQLINLVGELVITQAMLAQNSRALDPALYQQLLTGLTDLDRNTRDLQESVMSIRMIPMSIVFSRFPRMLRDLANKLGKKVDFVTQGEATELDKGLVEKITDPLTHLVRNSCDHGIEMPADRLRAGKPETGTITLSAAHQGGSIVIEVRDDGRGMSREKILTKARERGMEVSDQMPDSEVWMLIFAPGFSTAEVVTDVSGRGVGMDVVKRNIAALNGTVEIDSAEGYGMKVSIRLPLTLAIMDGMSVGVGEEVYILPLSSVVESFQVKSDAVSTVGQGAHLVKVRDEYMPVIELEKVFQVPRFDFDKSSDIMVVVEADGCRVALLVDELLGQQQVVVKNLESNYRKVPNISGATILGDGKVALILDTGALVRRSRH